MAIPLSLALNRIADSSPYLALLTFAAFVITAAWLCQRGEEIFRQKDCSKIVVDEIAGFLLANFASPAKFWPIIFAFLLFRFFDIIKPFPAARAEKIPGGLGVIADDLIAGLYTFVMLRLFLASGLL